MAAGRRALKRRPSADDNIWRSGRCAPRLRLSSFMPARFARLSMLFPVPIATWARRLGSRLIGRVGTVLVGLLLGVLALPAAAWDADRVMRSAERMGPRAVTEVRSMLAMMGEAGRLDEEGRLRVVNQFFNQHILFREDADNWGQIDYWASPLESLARGQGDCEDYAIAKYFTLLALNVPPAKLRMVYVRAQVSGVVLAHMVLAYYPEPAGLPLILDNLVGEIRSAARRPDLAPVFSFNAEGLWQGVGSASAGDPLARLSRWRDVLNKARQEGMW